MDIVEDKSMDLENRFLCKKRKEINRRLAKSSSQIENIVKRVFMIDNLKMFNERMSRNRRPLHNKTRLFFTQSCSFYSIGVVIIFHIQKILEGFSHYSVKWQKSIKLFNFLDKFFHVL